MNKLPVNGIVNINAVDLTLVTRNWACGHTDTVQAATQQQRNTEREVAALFACMDCQLQTVDRKE